MINPLRNPMKRARTMTKATTGKTSGSRPSIMPVVRHEAILTTEPMDKSIPAVRIAKVWPTLTSPSGAA
jgi:hypothetical protein